MIVCAESNFVLELAFQQEESAEVRHVVGLAEAGRLELIIPACCFAESYQTLIRRKQDRSALRLTLKGVLTQLYRSREFVSHRSQSEYLLKLLKDGDDVESRDLEATIRCLTGCCTVLPLTKEVIQSARSAEAEFRLGPHDALVLASVEHALSQRGEFPKVFMNKNSKDFDKKAVTEQLLRYNCKLLTNFATARQFIDHQLTVN